MIKNRQLNVNECHDYIRMCSVYDWEHVMINLLAVSIDFQTETVDPLN